MFTNFCIEIFCYYTLDNIQAGKFDFAALVLKIGSGIALLAIVRKEDM